jgi:hypothetical protein
VSLLIEGELLYLISGSEKVEHRLDETAETKIDKIDQKSQRFPDFVADMYNYQKPHNSCLRNHSL